MPTKHKREAVQLRPEVHNLILQLATETSLSKSKVLSLLVEEALKARGMYDGPALSANAKMLPPDLLEKIEVEAGEKLPEDPILAAAKEAGFSVQSVSHKEIPKRDPDRLSFTQHMHQKLAEAKIREQAQPTDTDVSNNPASDDAEMMRKIKVLQAAGIL